MFGVASQSQPSVVWCQNTRVHWKDEIHNKYNEWDHSVMTGFQGLLGTEKIKCQWFNPHYNVYTGLYSEIDFSKKIFQEYHQSECQTI